MDFEQGQLSPPHILQKKRSKIPNIQDCNILPANESPEEGVALTRHIIQFI